MSQELGGLSSLSSVCLTRLRAQLKRTILLKSESMRNPFDLRLRWKTTLLGGMCRLTEVCQDAHPKLERSQRPHVWDG